MRRILAILAIALVIGCLPAAADTPAAPFSIGFGVSIPYTWPVDWARSFSYVTAEAFLSNNLTAALDLGTYPSDYPDLFEGTASLLVKAWVGPVNAFAGGGFTLQGRRVGSAWGYSPHLTLKGGFQLWLANSAAVVIQFRTHEALPVTWTFSPEFSLGMAVALGGARPSPSLVDPTTLWLVIGLGVAALIAFLPKK